MGCKERVFERFSGLENFEMFFRLENLFFYSWMGHTLTSLESTDLNLFEIQFVFLLSYQHIIEVWAKRLYHFLYHFCWVGGVLFVFWLWKMLCQSFALEVIFGGESTLLSFVFVKMLCLSLVFVFHLSLNLFELEFVLPCLFDQTLLSLNLNVSC